MDNRKKNEEAEVMPLLISELWTSSAHAHLDVPYSSWPGKSLNRRRIVWLVDVLWVVWVVHPTEAKTSPQSITITNMRFIIADLHYSDVVAHCC